MNSYNTKKGTTLDYTTNPTLDISYLYVPHTSEVDTCYGYKLASLDTTNTGGMWGVNCGGVLCTDAGDDFQDLSPVLGVRPTVSLPSNISVTKEGSLWTVTK